jgi:DNA-binding transcriptional regulator YdaS (Cro superfamily)
MNLSDYIAEQSLTHQAFADLLGVTRPTVSYWLAGKTRPAPVSAALIIQLTRGKVTPDDFQRAWQAAR